MSQSLTQIQELQNKVNSLLNARDFYDPEKASSSGASHVPSQPLIIPSAGEVPSRDPGLPRDTRFLWVLRETFLKAHLLEKDPPHLSSKIQRIRHHRLADWDQEILWNMGKGEKRSAEFFNTNRAF